MSEDHGVNKGMGELMLEYEEVERRKRAVFTRLCETEPQLVWMLQSFEAPMSKSRADQILLDQSIAQSYQVYGSPVLKCFGLSFFQRQTYKLSHCFQFLFM